MSIKNVTEVVVTVSLLSFLTAGAFGAFGALIHYLYTIVKTEGNYSTKMLIWFMLFGFFVALMLNYAMIDLFGRSYDGILLLSGFLVIRILDFLDANGLGLLLRRVGIKDVNKINKK